VLLVGIGKKRLTVGVLIVVRRRLMGMLMRSVIIRRVCVGRVGMRRVMILVRGLFFCERKVLTRFWWYGMIGGVLRERSGYGDC